MSKRFWLLGLVGLVLVAFLVACGSKYNSSSNGLVIVGSQGSGLLETFSVRLDNGQISAIANNPNDTANDTCVLNGLPSSIVIDPAGQYAYTIINASTLCDTSNSPSQTGILAFKINSDGSITQAGSLVADPTPQSLYMDAAGKFLFVAEGGGVNVYAIGSGGALTLAPSNYTIPPLPRGVNIVAVAASPTVFPGIGINGVQNAVCSAPGNNAPTSQYLYAVDSSNYVVLEFSVDMTTGALGNPVSASQANSFATDQVPLGVAVDPCNRFVYVSDSLTNKVSAYTICSQVLLPGCPVADGSLLPVAGSPFALSGSANGPGPLVVDPFGNNVYVVGTLSNTLSAFKISPVSGALTPLTVPTVATGLRPTSIAIRGDDNWMFVTNFNAQTVSQYSITPATGALTVEAPIDTDNQPWGVAVK
ncbi:MAG TPA: beta-propeller fold lactonase family protein [Candidatus Sulfotelmatobacter sp.]